MVANEWAMNLYYVFYDKNVYKNLYLVKSKNFLQLTDMLIIPFSCLELNWSGCFELKYKEN